MSDGSWDDCKVFVSRIPAVFEESSVKRLLEERLGEGSVVEVALKYPKGSGEEEREEQPESKKPSNEHRGFAFVTFSASDLKTKAIALETIRGGAKPTSTKKHTLYIRPVVRDGNNDEDDDDGNTNNQKQVCFLWAKFRCPYGDGCKFVHEGEGGCVQQGTEKKKKKKKKCFAYKKGKCKRGDDCPFSHDFEVKTERICEEVTKPVDRSQKHCINWKTKGKCRKGDKCLYLHDEAVREEALRKKEERSKKRKQGDVEKVRQPLSIRVFGLNYDTNQEDVREYFRDCGTIVEITFPTFEDSGRSKGYCGVLFQSPKAVAKAVELDGQELHGRWLRVQAGKMYLKQWEEQHNSRKETLVDDDNNNGIEDNAPEQELVGEFGQRVKRRKKHGYKE